MSKTASDILTLPRGATIINAGKHPGKREIAGAIRYDPKQLLEAKHLALPIAHDGAVILYGEHGSDDQLRKIAEKFRADGFTNVRVYDGTLADYEKAGGATQESSNQQIIPPSSPGKT
jgi:rhodanese-related sulfurtransferase